MSKKEIIRLFNDILYREPTDLELEHHVGNNTEYIDAKKQELLSCHERIINQTNLIEKFGKSPLKIAIMLVGHFRRFEPYEHIWRDFKKNHPNVDFFIHSWKERGDRCAINWIDMEDHKDIDFENIYDVLKPVSIIREDHKKMINDFGLRKRYPDKNIYLSLGQKVCNQDDFTKFVMSQLYGIYRCYKSVENYQKEKGFTYDIVIKLRADTIFYHPLIFKNRLPDNELYIHSRSHRHGDGGGGCLTCDSEYPARVHEEHTNDVCDVLVYGNNNVMKRYCVDMYENMEEILDKFDVYNKNLLTKYSELYQYVTQIGKITYYAWCGDFKKNLKLFYPEQIIRTYMNDVWLLSDPYYL